MRNATAKSLRQTASNYTKQNPENFRIVYKQTKKLWNATPRKLRNKIFN